MDESDYERRRLSFGAHAKEYELFRPTYPDSAIRFVLGDRPLRVLDLGAGTGLLTRAVASHGHDVLAVEPDPQMLAVLTETLSIEATLGHAEQIPIADAAVDAVTVGSAFHWFDQALALPEISRVLRPRGILGIFWNVLDDRVPWVDAICRLTGGENRWSETNALADPDLAPLFAPAGAQSFSQTQQMTLDELIGLIASWSFVQRRDDCDELVVNVRRAVVEHPDLYGQQQYSLPYLTSTFRFIST